MNAFRFFFEDDDEGFEPVEEAETTPESDNDDEEGESTKANDNEDEVIWEETED